MKFSALVVDFDGTIARDDVLDPTVREAIAELRAQGIVVLLATGRILEDLRRVAGELHFVDAVIAENGAVVAFPDTGVSTTSGLPPPASLLAALRREGIRHEVGRVVVDADANDAHRILTIIRRLELPQVIAFNRGRLMILPQAVSKATGVRQALTILRLSPHNTVAIGDAENDHEMLRLCEAGIAVDWGSEALKAAADCVLPGDGPSAVATYVRALANRRRVPVPLQTRRSLRLGYTDDGAPFDLAVRGRNVLVAGDPKSGKSWVAGLLCEQLILQGYGLCVLDPEGDYTSLEGLPGVTVFGGTDRLPRPCDLLRALRHADVSVVINLSHASHALKTEYMKGVLESLATLRKHTGLPHRIVVDEAHYFLHDAGGTGLLDLDFNGYTLVSYRSSQLDPRVLAASQAIVVTCESDPHEVRALYQRCASCRGRMPERDWEQLLGGLPIGEAVVLPVTDEAGGEMRRIRLAPRLTPHVRHFAKYVDIPVAERRAFVFWRDGLPTGQQARTLRDFVAVLDGAPAASLDGHLKRGDFSKWLEDVFGDYPLARTVRAIESDYRAGTAVDVPSNLARAVRARYELLDPIAISV